MRLSSEARQAAWLTIGTWTLSALLYLIPFGFFQKDPIFYVALTVFNICLLGALLSIGVYWTARRVRQRHWTFRFAAVAAAVIVSAAALAMLDGLAGQILAESVYVGRPATQGPARSRRCGNDPGSRLSKEQANIGSPG